MHSALGFLPTFSAVEPSLPSRPQRRIHQHAERHRPVPRKEEAPCRRRRWWPPPATISAPASAPTVPRSVIPPLVPGGTVSAGKEVTRRPRAPRTDGSSPGIRGGHSQACGHDPSTRALDPASAPTAATPPLASTCQWSRREPLAPRRMPGSGLTRDTILPPIKKVRSAAPPGSPVPVRMAVPTAVAATAPGPVRARRAQGQQGNGRADQETGWCGAWLEVRCKGIDRLTS